MIVLDTNVVSEFMRQRPEPRVVDWLHQQPSRKIWTTSITVFEIQHGLNIMPAGKRQHTLFQQFHQSLEQDFEGRILGFDTDAAKAAADVSAKYKTSGKGADIRDMQIAGIVHSRAATLATRNIKDFRLSKIELVDPWNS
jgi:predicted nucleic acid-binding protein